MGKNEHSEDVIRLEMQQPTENEQTDGFVAADLSRRGRQDVEHVVDSVSEDSCSQGYVVANGPESEHGKHPIEGQGYTGEQDRGQEDARTACTQKEGVDEARGEAFYLVSDRFGKHACYRLEKGDGACAFPGCQTDKRDQADE